MTRLYRMLLRLYPRQTREEFGDEMLAVFSAAAHDGGGLWFLLRECGGLVQGAAREREPQRYAPALAAIGLTSAMQWAFYSWFGRWITAASSALSTGSLDGNDVLALGLMALAALLCLFPIILLACRRVQLDSDRRRLRPIR